MRIRYEVDADFRGPVTVFVLRRDVPAGEPGYFGTEREAREDAIRRITRFAERLKEEAWELRRERTKD
jgi:hypothetical protein